MIENKNDLIPISFSKFKKETHHKKVKYIWTSKNGQVVKEFETDKFYCNPFGLGKDKMYSMPKFNLSATNEWFMKNNKYIHKSEYGKTIFEIIE